MSHDLTTTLKNVEAEGSRCSQRRNASRWATTGGVLSALGICSACCLLPAILIGLGVTGAWVSALDSLSRFKWYFVIAAGALLGYGLVLSYSRNTGCGASGCASCRPSKAVRIGLWVGVVLAVAGLLFEMIEPMLAGK
jgi:mercuric ion transport protein